MPHHIQGELRSFPVVGNTVAVEEEQHRARTRGAAVRRYICARLFFLGTKPSEENAVLTHWVSCLVARAAETIDAICAAGAPAAAEPERGGWPAADASSTCDRHGRCSTALGCRDLLHSRTRARHSFRPPHHCRALIIEVRPACASHVECEPAGLPFTRRNRLTPAIARSAFSSQRSAASDIWRTLPTRAPKTGKRRNLGTFASRARRAPDAHSRRRNDLTKGDECLP